MNLFLCLKMWTLRSVDADICALDGNDCNDLGKKTYSLHRLAFDNWTRGAICCLILVITTVKKMSIYSVGFVCNKQMSEFTISVNIFKSFSLDYSTRILLISIDVKADMTFWRYYNLIKLGWYCVFFSLYNSKVGHNWRVFGLDLILVALSHSCLQGWRQWEQ